MADSLSKILDMRDDPYRWAREFKERTGRSVIGYFCSYIPDELICAADVLPVRVIGDNKQRAQWGAHLQNYCCSFSRTALDVALSGEFDFAEGFIFSHTCDTMQRLSDIWRINNCSEFHADLVLPVRLEGDAALDYLIKELNRLRSELEARFGKIGDGKIRSCIEVSERNRELLRELYELKAGNPGTLSSDELIWLVTSSSVMDREEHNRLLEASLVELRRKGMPDKGARGKIPLFGIGSVMDQWEFLRMLDGSGGTIVDDDFCNGRRYLDGIVGNNEDPVTALASRVLSRAECPCKHRADRPRQEVLLGRIRNSGAKGVIFFLLKYCDPHFFEYPHLKKALDEIGIPSLLIEAEHGSVPLESMRTRVDALLETIRES